MTTYQRNGSGVWSWRYISYKMRTLVCLCMLYFPLFLDAQKYDYVWIIGDNNNLSDTTHGGAIVDFNNCPVKAVYHYRELDMFVCNVSICDSTGGLIFYSNGCSIANASDTIIPNGDNINPGIAHQIACIQNNGGYASNHQSAVILPLPETVGIFYLFHKSENITFNPTVVTTDKLLYSLVDMNMNGGVGQVVEKNIPVIIDSLAFGEMNAIKHSNGKDWWILTPRKNSNQFYVFLFTKDGIVDTLTQTIGDVPPANQEGYGQTVFSPDGTRMIRYFPDTDIMNFSFDRSTGVLTNYSTFSVSYGNDLALQGGCAISPSGRYLYIAALLQVYQFDLWASDISSSQIKVAIWDGFVDPVAITFLTCQLGPDCKIYILGGGDTRYYHIIHNPDEAGLACNVQQRGLVLPTPSGASIPYFPNYRLGPIDDPGLPCSPIVATNQPVTFVNGGVSVFPNPADNQATFVFHEPITTAKQLHLFDVYGHLVKEVSITSASEAYTLPVADLPSGIYFWEVSFGQGRRDKGRLMVQH